MYFLLPDLFLETDVLAKTIARLPLDVDVVDMSDNINLSREHIYLDDLFAAIPPSVIKLSLRDNNLGKNPSEDLARPIAKLPNSLRILVLSKNNLSNRLTEELIHIFSSLPTHIESLDLSENEFSNKPAQELRKIFNTLTNVKALYLGKTYRAHSSLKEIEFYMAAVPRQLVFLDFSNMVLICRKDDELAKVISNLPSGLLKLNLSNNRLGWNNSTALAQGMAALPQGLEYLDLSNNALGKLSEKEFIQVFATIPPSITTLNLNGNLFKGDSDSVCDQLFKMLPHTVTSIYVNDRLVAKTPSETESLSSARSRLFTPSPPLEPAGSATYGDSIKPRPDE